MIFASDKRFGIVAETAADAHFFETVKKHKPNVAGLDVKMPALNGFNAAVNFANGGNLPQLLFGRRF